MTKDEFIEQWTQVRPLLERLIETYLAMEYYKSQEGQIAHRADMMTHALNLLEHHNLGMQWGANWCAIHVPIGEPQETLEWIRCRALHNAGLSPGGIPAVNIEVQYDYMPLVRINAPEWFQRRDFMRWLCSDYSATWHKKLNIEYQSENMKDPLVIPNMKADSGSDVFFTWSGPVDGSDSPHGSEPHIPSDIWEFICEKLWHKYGPNGEALVWLTNLD